MAGTCEESTFYFCQLWAVNLASLVHAHSKKYSYISRLNLLRGYCITNQKLACFVLYLKIINTFLKNDICMSKELKNDIKI